MEEKKRQNPYYTYESILSVLSAGRIDNLLQDQELLRDKWKIHFAIDPYDIGKFCFPFSPTSLLSQFKTTQIEEIARLQNGRYEAVYNLSTQPILLEPYVEELESHVDWAKWSSYVPTKSELLDRYLQVLRIPTDKRPKEVKEILKELTHKDISSLIAIVTGIVSIGVERLNDVLTNRLVRGSPDGPLEKVGLNLVSRDEVVSKAINIFENYFESVRSRKRGLKPSRWADRSKEIIEINNRRDALAVDQLLQLNEIYNPKKCLILYLSSSPKSADLFGSAGISRPMVNGKPYDLVRTAKDLFIYMVYRGDLEDPVQNAEVAMDKLTELKELISNVERIRDRFKTVSLLCEHCNKDESLPLCELGSHCEGVLRQGEHIAQRQEANINLSMQKRLAQAIDNTRLDSKGAIEDKYGQILKILSELIKDEHELKAINQEMEVNVQSSITKMRFVSAFVTSTPSEIGGQVSCYLNSYPVRLRVTDDDLRTIVECVVRLLPKTSWSIDGFYECVGRYLKMDANWDIKAESELIRSFLYSILGESDKAKEIAERFLEDKETDDKIVREFRYLQGFTLWHADEFKRAVEVADEGIKKYKKDGRFYHHRSIVIWDFLAKYPNETDYVWRDVVEAAERAIELFSKAEDRDMVAVNYNNLACAYSSNSLAGVDSDIAVRYLGELVQRIPEAQWDPDYPEFYHTKGGVLLATFLTDKDESVLIDAYEAAMKAFNMFPEKLQHRELKEMIEKYSIDLGIQLPQFNRSS